MASPLLDFKNWKHVSSDDKKTVLQHKKGGHQLTLAHDVLSPAHKSQLMALSKISKENQTANQAQEAQDQQIKRKPVFEAGGGSVMPEGLDDMYATGGKVGLYANIHAKQERIKHGSGEHMRKPGSEGAPNKQAFKESAKTANMAMGGDPGHEANMESVPDKGYGRILIIGKSEGGEVRHYVEGGKVDKIMDILGGSMREDTKAAESQKNVKKDKESESHSIYDHPEAQQGTGFAQGGQARKMYADPQDQVSQDDSAPIREPAQEPGQEAGSEFRDAISSNPKVRLADEVLKKVGSVAQKAPGFIEGLLHGKKENLKISQDPNENPQVAPDSELNQTPQTSQLQPETNPIDDSIKTAQSGIDEAYKNQLAGLNQEVLGKEQQAKEQKSALENSVQAQNKAKEAFQTKYDDLEKERQNLMLDIQNGHIDPEQFWTGDKDGNGGHSKIMTGLGIILAGFNPTNNPNAALNFLKFQMEQNLNAQKENLNSKNNLLAQNLRQFGNLKDATDMTRLQQADMLHNQMLMAATKAATPLAKAEMLQKAGQLEQQYIPLRQQFAMRQAMMDLAQNGTHGNDPSNTAGAEHFLAYARAVPGMENTVKDMESRLVPGVGLAKKPIPESGLKEITAHSDLKNGLDDLEKFTKTHTTLIPGTPEYNTGLQKAILLQTQLREGLLNTVYREGEQPLLDKLIKGNPANILKEFNTLPQIKELKRNNEARTNTLYQQYGLPSVQSDTVKVIGPNGQSGSIPRANLQKALKMGYKAQ